MNCLTRAVGSDAVPRPDAGGGGRLRARARRRGVPGRPPDFVLLVHKDTAEFGAPSFGRDYARELGGFLAEAYEPVALLGAEPFTSAQFGMKLLRRRKVPAVNVLAFTALLFSGAAAAGLVGALTGLGGGVVLVPLLTLGLGVDIKYAIGTALVAVIATSSGAAAAYVREGFSNVRIGLFFEIATTLGALLGAFLASRTPTSAIAVIFGVVLLTSVAFSWKVHRRRRESGRPIRSRRVSASTARTPPSRASRRTFRGASPWRGS